MKTQIDTTKPYFALIYSDSIWIEGDERSRTAPGHGYPAHSKDVTHFEPYATESELLEAVKRERRINPNKTIQAVRIAPFRINTETTISLG